ncbi:carnitine transporter [Clostridiales bacterium S5-A14a]|nr:carnitine transporter [Clostridiales bacterium S5-A14a]
MIRKKIDWLTTILPLVTIVILSTIFLASPKTSNDALSKVRFFFGDTFGAYYLVIGIIFFTASLVLIFSKYGDIVLGSPNEKPAYSFFSWGSMMFTCGLAADILFYSFSEWIMYGSNDYIKSLGSIQEWSGVFPIFHWSFIPWSFYLVLAVSFGFMLHVRKRNRKKFSEACRPLLGKYSDGIPGKIIDLLSVFALLAGTATTFSVATPLIAEIVSSIFNISLSRTSITIIILIITCAIYTYALIHGFKGINILAKACIYMFFGLILYVLLFAGSTKYIIDTGLESLGRTVQNFISLSTHTDPLRQNNFPQDWTIYYWAYWMVWCVAAPFFIGNISKGRTIREVVIGGYIFGVGSTIVSFIVLGNYSLGMQVNGIKDFIGMYESGDDLYKIIISIIETMPNSDILFLVILFTMIAFYATSFDSIAYTAACYSYYQLSEEEHPHFTIQLLWCILLIVLPIALVFSQSSLNNLQSVSIIAAFPIGLIMFLIVISFFKDAKEYIEANKNRSMRNES